jgi:cbb3-type cytochrome oxidase subunit 3
VTGSSLAYFLFGLSLTLLLGWVIVHYFTKRRHEKIEEAKYRMLDDDQ